ncbi:MASE1 domain-containing protein [Dyella lipolytica]|uniref:MASE1 domain-containing protein n=1 Tax=Dyella lipolytica TaxID=1867835 RepID=A0ABW8IR41_9GAMM|nr:MASE1 domain-containing protein [Dyella lipolytica]
MWKGILKKRWVRHAAVSLGYALVYLAVVHIFDNSPWSFTAALRITCLLVMPYRYWPALALGELGGVIYVNFEFIARFGLMYAVINAIPRLVVGMPVVWWFRNHAALFPAPHLVDVKKLLWCVLTLAVLWASLGYAAVLTARLPTGPYHAPEGTFLFLLSGAYMAMLVTVPWVVMIRLYQRERIWQFLQLRELATHSLTRDVAISILALAALTLLHYVAIDVIKPAAMMALFFPAAWLALKHGWRAAVLGGTLSLITTCLLVKHWSNPDTVQAQTFMAFAMTGLYTFGARISAQLHQHEQVTRNARETRDVAQSTLVFGEQRLQQTSQALECVAGILRFDHELMLERFVPAPEKNEYGKQAQQLQQQVQRLAENIHPSAWRERGLAAALDETIGQVLEDTDIAYVCNTPGRGLRFLSPALQVAVYRIVCEMVARFSASPACARIHLDMRIGHHDQVRWVVLRIRSVENEAKVARAALNALERYRVAPKLGATMKSFDELHRLARVFDGKLRRRTITGGMLVSALLCDAESQTQAQRKNAMPMRLWVR